MASLSSHHQEGTPLPGRCSVSIWCEGCLVGFCNAPAWGGQTKEYLESFKSVNSKYPNPRYAPGLACLAHGGPNPPQEESDATANHG